jgi:hypothetical protein
MEKHILKKSKAIGNEPAVSVAKYDVALSFAGEDRVKARDLAKRLRSKGYQVFFDEFEKAALWGDDLTVKLKKVYMEESRFCVIFVSKYYARKPWTNHERQAAMTRAFEERRPYILPLRLDSTDLPGLSNMLGYIDLRSISMSETFTLLTQKLGPPTSKDVAKPRQTSKTKSSTPIRKVLAACYRRAVFSKVSGHENTVAMFRSLADCRVTLQKLIVYVEPEERQQLVASIISELDFIERRSAGYMHWSFKDFKKMAAAVDGAKIRIIAALLQLSKAAKISFVLPPSITADYIYSKEDADAPPSNRLSFPSR